MSPYMRSPIRWSDSFRVHGADRAQSASPKGKVTRNAHAHARTTPAHHHSGGIIQRSTDLHPCFHGPAGTRVRTPESGPETAELSAFRHFPTMTRALGHEVTAAVARIPAASAAS